MAKVVTVRLSDGDYHKIAAAAQMERRPLSNFMTLMVIKGIEESAYVDTVEMDQILSDKTLLEKIRTGHREARQRKGKLVD